LCTGALRVHECASELAILAVPRVSTAHACKILASSAPSSSTGMGSGGSVGERVDVVGS
jgi:hypothetical protein